MLQLTVLHLMLDSYPVQKAYEAPILWATLSGYSADYTWSSYASCVATLGVAAASSCCCAVTFSATLVALRVTAADGGGVAPRKTARCCCCCVPAEPCFVSSACARKTARCNAPSGDAYVKCTAGACAAARCTDRRRLLLPVRILLAPERGG